MDYKTELIKQLEELEADNTQHPSFYDGYGFAISDAIETIKKFNYIPCCKSDSELLDADFGFIVGKEAHFYKDGKIIKKEALKFSD